MVLRQQAVYQAGHEVRAEREPRGELAVALVFVPRTLQKWRVRQDICGRLDLTEELLRREQIASFRKKGRGVRC